MARAPSSDETVHVLLLPYPSQGHINPLLQFGKRLASHRGVRCTLAATRFVLSSSKPTPSSVHVAAISDGCDDGGPEEVGGQGAPYFARLESAGTETLDELLRSESEQGRPVHVVVYDAFVPWAQRVARRRGAAAAAFLTQPCAVDVVYAHAWAGRVPPPAPAALLLRPEEMVRDLDLPGLSTRLDSGDMPTFLVDPSYPPSFRELLVNQFLGLDTADHVLVNSFTDLEPQEAEYLASTWRAKMVGPTVPSAFLDNRLPEDVSYGMHLHAPMAAESKAWLDAQQAGSVVYVSFGSLASPGAEQMGEIAEGLYGSGRPFLWVVRATEAGKVPRGFAARATADARGLLVSWCPQLEVLAHPAVGCFFTHCGWNSTVEALCAGVPMVAMPDWSDQTTNAKYIQDVWRVGVRVRRDEGGVVRRQEVERCVRDVMEGETMGRELRERALEWSGKARKAMAEGGSSDVAISEFLSSFRHSARVNVTPANN